MSEVKNVLFDTDIGSDIDDAVALAYLLSQPACRLVGITTVTGEPERRAALASALCHIAGKTDIPIKSGAAKPLLVEQRQKNCPQAAVLSRWPHRSDFEPNQAVRFMQDVIRSRPGEITLLAVGPLTNVGLLFAMDPEIPSLLKELVLMCGRFTQRGAEWNALVDPHATAIVYSARVARHVSYGLDVTLKCQLSADECRQRFRGGIMDLVLEAAEVWFSHAQRLTFHDPLAAACVFTPDLCRYAEGRVDVELESRRLLGMTHWETQVESRPHQIAIDVDVERFFSHYFAVVGR
jgi:purine nucleosidase